MEGKINKKDFEILKKLQKGENPPEIFDLLRDKVFDIAPGAVTFHIDREGEIKIIKQETTIRAENI